MTDFVKFIDVLGSRMAYRQTGSPEGPTTLFLHGNPTSSYIWRHILPKVQNANCIAPDLIGFGQSDKPDLDYRFVDHVRFLDAFIDAMELSSVYLVAQDWGTALAFELAARRPAMVRGMAFMEFIRPFESWEDFHQGPAARELFQKFRTASLGEKLIIEDNVFIEQVLPASIHRKLSDDEMAHYRGPFTLPSSRRPVWRLPNELPVAGEPADVWAILTNAHEALRKSSYPKVLFHGTPGALVSPDFAERFASQLTNCTLIALGAGAHYLQEDHPQAIAQGVSDLIAGTEAGADTRRSGREIAITYCGPCGYLAKAKAAEQALQEQLSIVPSLVAGAGGVFRVSLGNEVLLTRKKGYFPSTSDVVDAVRRAMGR